MPHSSPFPIYMTHSGHVIPRVDLTAAILALATSSLPRAELVFHVMSCRSAEKEQRLMGFLQSLPAMFGSAPQSFYAPAGQETHSGLVFCPHVNGQFGVVQQARLLADELRIYGAGVDFYSGSTPRGVEVGTYAETKQDVAARFKRNAVSVLVATKAFGMGIDKPNVRFTVHTSLPQSIEAFYQEAGRSGRDRGTAHCGLIVSADDQRRAIRLLDPTTPIESIVKEIEGRSREEDDDITRALFFHVNNFRGITSELSDISYVVGILDHDLRGRTSRSISWADATGRSRVELERALHRLVVLAVIDDNVLDYGTREFTVTTSGASQEEIAAAFGIYAGSYQSRLRQQSEEAALEVRGRITSHSSWRLHDSFCNLSMTGLKRLAVGHSLRC